MNELGPDARGILDGGRDGDAPTAADRARLRAAVLQAIAAGSATAIGTSAAAAGATAGGTLSVGWKALLAVIAIGTLGTVTVVRHPLVSTNESRGSESGSLGETPKPPPQALALGETPKPPPLSTGVPSTPPSAETSAPEAARVAPVARSSAAPRTREAASGGAPHDSPAAPADPDTLGAETQRLRDAHAALKSGDASRALTLLDEHGSAGSQLREERAAGRVLALCDLGRVDEARAAAARFLADNPRSPLADRVRASCGGR